MEVHIFLNGAKLFNQFTDWNIFHSSTWLIHCELPKKLTPGALLLTWMNLNRSMNK